MCVCICVYALGTHSQFKRLISLYFDCDFNLNSMNFFCALLLLYLGFLFCLCLPSLTLILYLSHRIRNAPHKNEWILVILIFNLGFAACQADVVSAATAQRFFRHLV